MQRISLAPVLSATLSRDSCWITSTPVCRAGSHFREPGGTYRRLLPAAAAVPAPLRVGPGADRLGPLDTAWGAVSHPPRGASLCGCYWAFSMIRTTRQRLVADSGRVSIRSTRSPTPQALCSSCALYLDVRRMTLP